MTDHPQSLDDLVKYQKHCPQCGHANRLTAKVCINCGLRFPVETLIKPDDTLPDVTLRTGVVPLVRIPGKPTRAKTCPECGTVVDIDAKFCPTCGHAFSTDFSKSMPAATKSVPPPPAAPVGEPPIVQMPSSGVEMPATPWRPVDLPDLPPLPPLPSPPTPIVPVTPPPAAPPAASVDADADDSLDGAPAPDLTDVDLARLRRRNFR